MFLEWKTGHPLTASQLNAKSQKKSCRNVQPDAHLLTTPEAQAMFELSECEQLAEEEATAQKQSVREAADRWHNAERHRSAAMKIFEAPLLSYKCKNDLKDIAATFDLDDMGTIPEIVV